jgi:hypothetical protein
MERRLGAGCVRDVTVPVPSRGDLILRPDFARLLEGLVARCGAARGELSVGSADLKMLAGQGPLAARAALPLPDVVATPLVPWLLAAALLLALLELGVRRLAVRPADADDR